MTTIAYDGKNIAADSLDVVGTEAAPFPGVKLYPCSIPAVIGTGVGQCKEDPKQRVIVGTSGCPAHSRRQLNHYVNAPRCLGQPMTSLAEVDGSLIVVHLDVDDGTGKCVAYLVDRMGTITPITGALMAIGSGQDYAMGAMAAGKSAAQAVEIAGRFDIYTSGLVTINLSAPRGRMGGMAFPFYLD